MEFTQFMHETPDLIYEIRLSLLYLVSPRRVFRCHFHVVASSELLDEPGIG